MTDVEFCQRVAVARRDALIMSAAAAALVLAGCSTTTPPIVPAQLLTCAVQPPSPAAATQRDVGLYIVDLAAAGDDCRTKLRSVSRILNPET